MSVEMTAGGETVDVSIVMVTYNAAEWTQRALAALAEGCISHRYELLVVDNASPELNKDDLTVWAGDGARVTFLTENVGFGRGCNRAVEDAKGRHILLVNPDAIVDPGAIDELIDFLDAAPRIGIAGGRITSPEGDLDYGSCWGHQTLWSLVCFATGLSTAFPRSGLVNPEGLGKWRRDSVRTVGIVTGCLLLIERNLWHRLEGFDDQFFMYGEDADLCKRAWDLGYTPSITPASHAIHAIGASSSNIVNKQVLLFRGKATLIRKNSVGIRRRVERLLLLTGVWLRSGLESAAKKKDKGWSGLWERRDEWKDGW